MTDADLALRVHDDAFMGGTEEERRIYRALHRTADLELCKRLLTEVARAGSIDAPSGRSFHVFHDITDAERAAIRRILASLDDAWVTRQA
jgi:hypothetical protein